MTYVFARPMRAGGVDYESGDPVPEDVFTEQRMSALINLRRVVDELADDPRILVRAEAESPTVVESDAAQVLATEPEPEPESIPSFTDSTATVVENDLEISYTTSEPPSSDTDGPDPDGLWPCRIEGCDRRLASLRGRTNHERNGHFDDLD